MSKVFQTSAITAAVSKHGSSVYVGTHELKHFAAFVIGYDKKSEKTIFLIHFNQDNDPKVKLEIEEEQRLLRSNGWEESLKPEWLKPI